MGPGGDEHLGSNMQSSVVVCVVLFEVWTRMAER